VTVTAGHSAGFSVTATGTAPLSYQWSENGTPISGATGSSYSLSATTSDNGASFQATVTNSAGSATSNAAKLTVTPAVTPPAITSQPASLIVTAGQSAAFSVKATGTAPLNYQWSKNGAPISGATGSSYSLSATTSDNGASFQATVTNSAGSVTSNAATLTVNESKPSAGSYNTSFSLTEDPITEQGVWINGGTAGLDWKNVRTTPGLAFGTQSGSGSYDDSTAVLAGIWKPDQMAQATVRTVNQSSSAFEEVELRLRTRIAPHSVTGYEINFRCTSDGSQYVQIVRWNGPLGSFSYVDATPGPGLHNGDVVKATVVGQTITVYINGKQVLQATDSTFTSGSPGIGFFLHGSANNADFGFTSFSAANMN